MCVCVCVYVRAFMCTCLLGCLRACIRVSVLGIILPIPCISNFSEYSRLMGGGFIDLHK